MSVDWINLPEHLWVEILQQLDGSTLIRTSETCRMFNNLIGSHIILIDKLKLVFNIIINHQNNITEKTIENMENLKRSVKKFRILEIRYSKEPSILKEDFWKLATKTTIEMITIFSNCIREVHLKYFRHFSDCDYKSIRKMITTLKHDGKYYIQYLTINLKCRWKKRYLQERAFFYMKDVDNDSRISTFRNQPVAKVELVGRFSSQYENVLLRRRILSLTVDTTQMFDNNKLSKVPFSLNFLNLFNAKWTNKQHALNFIKTQTRLITVHLRFDINQFDILFLDHIVNRNPFLASLCIQLDGCDSVENNFHQLRALNIKPHVHACIRCIPENPTLSTSFMELFPKNKWKCSFDDT